MRTLLVVLCGVLIGIGVTAAWRSLREPDRGAAAQLAAEVARLQAENASLVARLAASTSAAASSSRPAEAVPSGAAPTTEAKPPAAPEPEAEPTGPLPEAAALASLLEAKDHAALARELERLLLGGEEGFRTLLEFLRSGVKPPGYALWQDRRLTMTLLRLAFLHEKEAGSLAAFLMDNLDPTSDAALRMQLIGFLPGFLVTLGEAGDELRAKLETAILADFEPGATNRNIWASAQAMRDMGLELPTERLREILLDPEERQQHWFALQEVARRGDDESVDLVIGFVNSSRISENPSLRQAYYTLGGMDHPRAQEALRQLALSEDKDTRDAATLAYFSRQKPLGALPIALGYLDSDATAQQKQMLLWQLRGSNSDIFEAVKANASSISSEETRKILDAVSAGKPYQIVVPGGPGAVGVSVGGGTSGAVVVPPGR